MTQILTGFHAYSITQGYLDHLDYFSGVPTVQQVVSELTADEALVNIRKSIVTDRPSYACWMQSTLVKANRNAPINEVPYDFVVEDRDALKMAAQLHKEIVT